jgi:hypothetical protein
MYPLPCRSTPWHGPCRYPAKTASAGRLAGLETPTAAELAQPRARLAALLAPEQEQAHITWLPTWKIKHACC